LPRVLSISGEGAAQIILLAANYRNIDKHEVDNQEYANPDIARSGGESDTEQNRSQVKRIAHVRIWAGHRQLAIFLHLSRSQSAYKQSDTGDGYAGGKAGP
jgi:hypothetical protein